MRVAVNTRFLLNDYLEGYGYFLFEILKRIAITHPGHEFIFIFDRPFDKKFVFAENVTPVVAGPAARHPVLWKYWYDVNVPAILRKYKADVFVSCDGFCSLATKVPQCLLIHDLAFLHYPDFMKKSHLLFYKHYTPKFLKKAASIATVSEFSKEDICRHYRTGPETIDVIFNAAKDIFRPVTDEEKQSVKNKYTDGKEYFIYAGAIHPRKNLVNLLKAFSVFKKKQKSNWKLVLAGRLAWKYKHFVESLKTYKYRDDVVLTGYLQEEELVKVMGSSYALIYPSFWEGFGVPVLEAMQCRVPVITSANSAMQEIAKDAALYVNPADHNDIAEKILLLYKDENLRSRLIAKGVDVGRQYNWDRSAELLWQTINKAMH
ncbi:MAG: glycosyltransferase family 4 protein [Chitinophagaceae bacterium]|nr:glycosyltransferase family 4 protein [Chitinophagaceae bacterium]